MNVDAASDDGSIDPDMTSLPVGARSGLLIVVIMWTSAVYMT